MIVVTILIVVTISVVTLQLNRPRGVIDSGLTFSNELYDPILTLHLHVIRPRIGRDAPLTTSLERSIRPKDPVMFFLAQGFIVSRCPTWSPTVQL